MKIWSNFGFRKPKLDINSLEFYRKHPDLTPRNVYLSLGRVIDKTEIERRIENFGEPFWVRAKNWFKYKIEDILKSKK